MESKKLFLASFFKDVARLFPEFAGQDIQGKRVTFIPTASIHEKLRFYVGADRKALEKIGLIVDELEVSKASSHEIVAKLRGNDCIFISGGNTFFLLQELQRTGADKIIAEEIRAGKLYIGSSAGSVVLSPDIEYIKAMDSCSAAPDLKAFTALNIVDFYPVPHHTNFPFKKTVEKIIAKYGSELKLYPISNKQVILVDGDTVEVKEK
ncbi:MAG: Type 1 glutamine amidotransferase-like domain-containing protein [Prevotellaceae bacterium]|jgi:dipeptidase E|nr:Type 1 glutamine amidotransferase-like domain-containing protein [Prevotellaceae bacterium]